MITLSHLKIIKNRKIFNKLVGQRIVYKITNLINKKCYIGVTSRIKRRIYEHTRYSEIENSPLTCYLHNSIKKYGCDNFIFEVIHESIKNDEELNKLEIYYIKKFQSNNSKYGYNLTSGGERGIPNDITILKKIASSHKTKVAKYDLNGSFICEYESVKEASRQNNIPDTDIHRCHKNKWSRNNFLYQKFIKNAPLKIRPYTSNKGKNLVNGDGFQGKNKIKCQLFNKKTNLVEFEAESLEELSNKSGLHTTTLHRIYDNESHKKWKLIKIK